LGLQLKIAYSSSFPLTTSHDFSLNGNYPKVLETIISENDKNESIGLFVKMTVLII